MPVPTANAKLYLATSNAAKLEEIRALAAAFSSAFVGAELASARSPWERLPRREISGTQPRKNTYNLALFAANAPSGRP